MAGGGVSGIFNSAIFNNAVFNTGATVPAPQTGGHFGGVDDRKRRKLEREAEESRRKIIANLFANQAELPPTEREEVAEIQAEYAEPTAKNAARVDYTALLADVESVRVLLEIHASAIRAEAEEADDEDAIMALMQ